MSSLTVPSLTGALGDFGFASSAGSATTLLGRFWNEAGNTYSAQIATSWANFAAAQPGGFHFDVHFPQTDAHVIGA